MFLVVFLACFSVAFFIKDILGYDFRMSGVDTIAILMAAGIMDYISRKRIK